MIDRAAVERVSAGIRQAVKAGARILTGGKAHARFLEPTILEDVDPRLDICAKEVFGPVVILHRYEHFEEALDAVNDSEFGLQAGVFTQTFQRAFRAFETLETGGVLINNVPSFRAENMPYGGIKDSGFGREGIRYALEEMTELKSLIFNVQPKPEQAASVPTLGRVFSSKTA
jgi:acyl-CoA reductase-like NAD-dependent aldehyde dehydrogenase